MIKRCYDEKFKEKHNTYVDCEVCIEWLYYPDFKKWYYENQYDIDECLELDKDILHKGNKIYSPDNCLLIPKRINILFTKCDKSRGEYPIGVDFHNSKYRVRCSVVNNNKFLGYFNTPEEAFYVYKRFKEEYIKQVADEYKDKIPQRLYEAMYKWRVDIND